MSLDETARIGILTVSDRAAGGEYEDRGGPAIHRYLSEVMTSPWEPLAKVIADEREDIESALIEFADAGCCLVITTGGTGPAARDVTPEATEAVCDKLLPGFGEHRGAGAGAAHRNAGMVPFADQVCEAGLVQRPLEAALAAAGKPDQVGFADSPCRFIDAGPGAGEILGSRRADEAPVGDVACTCRGEHLHR